MAVERRGEIQCAFPPKIGRDLPKIGRSRKRRESARNAASSLFWAARPPLSYFPLAERVMVGDAREGWWVLSRVSRAVPGSAACVRWPGARRARRGGFAREDFLFKGYILM